MLTKGRTAVAFIRKTCASSRNSAGARVPRAQGLANEGRGGIPRHSSPEDRTVLIGWLACSYGTCLALHSCYVRLSAPLISHKRISVVGGWPWGYANVALDDDAADRCSQPAGPRTTVSTVRSQGVGEEP